MVKRFEERLGAAPNADLTLNYSITTKTSGLAITKAQETNRFNLIGTATFNVTDAAGTVLTNGKVENFTSYSATGSTVATQTAKDDARARLAVILADMIATRVLLATADHPL